MPENYFCWGKSLICYVFYVQYFLSYLVIFFLYSFKVLLLLFTYIFLIVFLLVLFLRKSLLHFWREEKLFTQAIILSILFYSFIFHWIFCFYYNFIVYYFNFLSYLLYLDVKAFFYYVFMSFLYILHFYLFIPLRKTTTTITLFVVVNTGMANVVQLYLFGTSLFNNLVLIQF